VQASHFRFSQVPTIDESGRAVTAACGSTLQQEVSVRHPISGKEAVVLKEPELEMPKTVTEIRSLARSHTRTALNVLVGVMRNTKAAAPARIAAANAILDRGWGKAAQAIENGDDGALELIHRIERVIVHPENPDSENL
jgi:hypothetical protein